MPLTLFDFRIVRPPQARSLPLIRGTSAWSAGSSDEEYYLMDTSRSVTRSTAHRQGEIVLAG
jgi:hypothetical protein